LLILIEQCLIKREEVPMGRHKMMEIDKENFMHMVIEKAADIMANESMSSISIRKIAAMLECSPGLIYHYFEDKEQIISHLLISKYQKMHQNLKEVSLSEPDPYLRFEKTLKAFIKNALMQEKDYFDIMTCQHKDILKYTAVLYEGVSMTKPGFKLMSDQIIEMTGLENIAAEMIAQTIWSSTFGLMYRFHIEKIEDSRRDVLIKHHLTYHIKALKNYKT